jgi:hypothetical protein
VKSVESLSSLNAFPLAFSLAAGFQLNFFQTFSSYTGAFYRGKTASEKFANAANHSAVI